jgi:hypothetical protein
VISLASSRHISRISQIAIFLSVSRCADFGITPMTANERSDHRPGMPEVALQASA